MSIVLRPTAIEGKNVRLSCREGLFNLRRKAAALAGY
jgi:hypothetical protein